MIQPTPNMACPAVAGGDLQAVSQAAPVYVGDDKTDKAPAAAPAKDDKTEKKAPTCAPTTEPVFPTPVKDDGAAQKSAPSPVAQANLPAVQPIGAYLPGQLTPVAAPAAALNSVNGNVATGGESSSREISGVAASAPASFKPKPYSPVREAGRFHGMPRKWLILGAVEHGAATFDAYSTRSVITNGTGYEMNPMLRPFANSNALFGAVQVAPLAFDYLSLRMLHSSHPWMRKMWWVPQSASAAASMFGGIHNSMMH
jgi:hypothetical protein